MDIKPAFPIINSFIMGADNSHRGIKMEIKLEKSDEDSNDDNLYNCTEDTCKNEYCPCKGENFGKDDISIKEESNLGSEIKETIEIKDCCDNKKEIELKCEESDHEINQDDKHIKEETDVNTVRSEKDNKTEDDGNCTTLNRHTYDESYSTSLFIDRTEKVLPTKNSHMPRKPVSLTDADTKSNKKSNGYELCNKTSAEKDANGFFVAGNEKPVTSSEVISKRTLFSKQFNEQTEKMLFIGNARDEFYSVKNNEIAEISYFICNVCNKSFTTKSEVERHILVHTGEKPFTCDVCKKSFPRKCTLERHLFLHTGKKPFTCNVCNTSFSHNDTLKLHLRVHSGEKPFVCVVCKKAFSRNARLKQHLLILHAGEKHFTCNVCNLSFSKNDYLDNHLHTGEKPFTCNVCNKTFSKKTHLENHLRIHTGEKPFACEVCKKSFSKNSYLENHLRVHTVEKSFTCDECKKSFSFKSELKNHLRTHKDKKPFTCDICNKIFTNKNKVNRHLLVHSGEKPFTCNVCNKSFSQNSNLTNHLRVHTGEKPFTCKVCNKSFTQNFNLQNHLRMHT